MLFSSVTHPRSKGEVETQRSNARVISSLSSAEPGWATLSSYPPEADQSSGFSPSPWCPHWPRVRRGCGWLWEPSSCLRSPERAHLSELTGFRTPCAVGVVGPVGGDTTKRRVNTEELSASPCAGLTLMQPRRLGRHRCSPLRSQLGHRRAALRSLSPTMSEQQVRGTDRVLEVIILFVPWPPVAMVTVMSEDHLCTGRQI